MANAAGRAWGTSARFDSKTLPTAPWERSALGAGLANGLWARFSIVNDIRNTIADYDVAVHS
jgi:hypothetical protein